MQEIKNIDVRLESIDEQIFFKYIEFPIKSDGEKVVKLLLDYTREINTIWEDCRKGNQSVSEPALLFILFEERDTRVSKIKI